MTLTAKYPNHANGETGTETVSGWDCVRVFGVVRGSKLGSSQEHNSGGTPVISYTRGTDLSGTVAGAGGIGGLLARSAADNNYWTNWTHLGYHADGNGSGENVGSRMEIRSLLRQ